MKEGRLRAPWEAITLARTGKVAHLSAGCDALGGGDRTTMRFCTKCVVNQRHTLGSIVGLISDSKERQEVFRQLVGDEGPIPSALPSTRWASRAHAE